MASDETRLIDLQRRFERAPPLVRRVFVLRKLHNLNLQEIGERLGVSPDEVLQGLICAVRVCGDWDSAVITPDVVKELDVLIDAPHGGSGA